ncbi:hypothetical protein C7W93_11955 [Glaciimonas sp. PCH181]|nr:hypothetical protein C7W93_11955 [Glaciimonas sp. PCH181]
MRIADGWMLLFFAIEAIDATRKASFQLCCQGMNGRASTRCAPASAAPIAVSYGLALRLPLVFCNVSCYHFLFQSGESLNSHVLNY